MTPSFLEWGHFVPVQLLLTAVNNFSLKLFNKISGVPEKIFKVCLKSVRQFEYIISRPIKLELYY